VLWQVDIGLHALSCVRSPYENILLYFSKKHFKMYPLEWLMREKFLYYH